MVDVVDGVPCLLLELVELDNLNMQIRTFDAREGLTAPSVFFSLFKEQTTTTTTFTDDRIYLLPMKR